MAVFSKDKDLERVFGIALGGQDWPMYSINIPEEEGKTPYGLIIDSEGEAVKMWGRSEVGGAWPGKESGGRGLERSQTWEKFGGRSMGGVSWEGLGRSGVGGV